MWKGIAIPQTKLGLFSGFEIIGLAFFWLLFSTVWLLLKFSSDNLVSGCLEN